MPTQGTTTQRGYGTAHQRLRARIARTVRAGNATCWRCNQPIAPDAKWDLGHDDYDRSQYMGPEHVACNRATSGRRTPPIDTSRRW